MKMRSHLGNVYPLFYLENCAIMRKLRSQEIILTQDRAAYEEAVQPLTNCVNSHEVTVHPLRNCVIIYVIWQFTLF